MYWLRTCNYLKPFKGYFRTKEDADEKLYDLIIQSEPYYLKILKDEATSEIERNKEMEGDLSYRPVDRAQRKLESWKRFTEENLKCSISLVKLTGFKLKDIENIFTASKKSLMDFENLKAEIVIAS
jgi:hypothetical protein